MANTIKNEKTKMANVSLTYNFTFFPEDLGLSEDCSKEDFLERIDDFIGSVDLTDCVINEIETETAGF